MILILLFLSSIAVAETVEVTSVYDGDTFRANIKGWPPIVGERIPVRVLGIDTPEIRGKCALEKALEAKRVAEGLLLSAEKVELCSIQRGKYFRLLANVYVDGINFGDYLISKGLAVKYDGGTKIDWCAKREP